MSRSASEGRGLDDGALDDDASNDLHHRRIRSFVTRAGRLSPAQQRSRETLGPRYVLPFDGLPIHWTSAFAMEMGCAGVLMNTAVAAARDPVLMACAMKRAVEAGRLAYRAGRMPKKAYSASPSSPVQGVIGSTA